MSYALFNRFKFTFNARENTQDKLISVFIYYSSYNSPTPFIFT